MKQFVLIISLLANLSLLAQSKKPSRGNADTELKKYAEKLAHKFIITDSHIDLPTTLFEKKFIAGKDNNEIISTKKGDIDYTRAKAGGLDAPFMSIYIPSSYQLRPDFGKAFADSLIDIVKSFPKVGP